jgi:hypothetical protein
MATCPRCESELLLEYDGYKLLDASCTNEECTLGNCSPDKFRELTLQEYMKIQDSTAGEDADAAMDRLNP